MNRVTDVMDHIFMLLAQTIRALVIGAFMIVWGMMAVLVVVLAIIILTR